MRLAVVSHKVCWPSATSSTGMATDGGFPFQMRALSQLFDSTTLLVPVMNQHGAPGEVHLAGDNLSIRPLPVPRGAGVARKLQLPLWIAATLPRLIREIMRADAVHVPIPGDVGTIGILVAMALGKPLFIRHCGNWFVQRTSAEHFWRWLLERSAGERTVVLTTGGDTRPPSARNPNIQWIFSTSLTEAELTECARAPERGCSGDGPRLIIACRQEPRKGTGAVIESLVELARDYPGVSLDVVGDGGGLSAFKALAHELGIADRVRFHGKVDHDGVIRLLRNADVFCFPTTSSEGFPKAVLEALACGLPVVTTRVSVLGALIGAGGGYLLDAATPDAVAAGVRACVCSDQQYRMLSSAAQRTAAEYSLERWRDTIGSHLTRGWGQLRAHA